MNINNCVYVLLACMFRIGLCYCLYPFMVLFVAASVPLSVCLIRNFFF